MGEGLFGDVPWNVYSLFSIAIIAGLTHVPHVYLYSSAALKSLGSDVEEAARVVGAKPLQVALNVSLPMTMPALFYAGVLVFFLGFELFGLPLVLGDPEGHLVLATYLYKLTNKLGTPSYHLMAAVAVCIVAVTFPLVLLQRWLLKTAGKYVSVKGKATRQKLLPLGGWNWLALALVALWLIFTIVVPISGIALRAFVEQWGEGIKLAEVLTLDNFRGVFEPRTRCARSSTRCSSAPSAARSRSPCYTAIGARQPPAARRRHEDPRLHRDDPARDSRPARGPRVPVDLPVRAGPEGTAELDLLASGSRTRSCGSRTACG